MSVKKKVLADGSRICRPRKYMSRRYDELPSGKADAQHLPLALAVCQKEKPKSEYESLPHLTGRYSSGDHAMCLNQAGRHIELWYSSVLGGGGGNRIVYRYSGDLANANTYAIVSTKDGTGTLSFKGDFAKTQRVRLEFDNGDKETMKRFSKRATWSDRVMRAWEAKGLGSYHPVGRGILENEQAPLIPDQLSLLRQLLVGARVTELLAVLFSFDPDDQRNEIHAALTAVRKFYETKGFREPDDRTTTLHSPFAGADKARVRAQAWALMHGHKLKLTSGKGVEEEFTYYEWFQRVLQYNDNYVLGGVYLPLKDWFGVRPPQPFRYRLHLFAYGYRLAASIPLAGKVMKKLEKLSDKLPGGFVDEYFKKWILGKVGEKVSTSAGVTRLSGVLTVISMQKAGWKAIYPFDCAVGSIGTKGGGIIQLNSNITATGWCETPIEWLEQDFPGDANVFSGIAAGFDGKRAPNQIVINARGKGTDKGTQLVFDRVKASGGLNAVGIGWGEIGSSLPGDPPPGDDVRFKHLEYGTSGTELEDAGFALGSATVSEDARQKMRIMAANELAELRDPSSELTITAFADRVDRAWFNRMLSSMRAENLLTALKDCVGRDLKASVKTHGAGEDALKFLDYFFDFPDHKPDPKWRRAFAFLNSTSSVRFKVRDLMPPKK